MDELLLRWRSVVAQTAADLASVPDDQARWRPALGKWSIAEIVGHLIDSATHNHHRFVAAQFRSDLVFLGYAQDDWVRAQQYQTEDWRRLRDLWRTLNEHLAQVVAAMPVDALVRPRAVHNLDEIAWRSVPRDQVTTLGYFVEDYVGHLEHHLAQVRERLAAQTAPIPLAVHRGDD